MMVGGPRAWAAGRRCTTQRARGAGRTTQRGGPTSVGSKRASQKTRAHTAQTTLRGGGGRSATGARSPSTWRREGRAFACSASRGQLALATCHDATYGARRCQAHAGRTAQRRALEAGPMHRPQGSHNQEGAAAADNKCDGNGLSSYPSASLHHDVWGTRHGTPEETHGSTAPSRGKEPEPAVRLVRQADNTEGPKPKRDARQLVEPAAAHWQSGRYSRGRETGPATHAPAQKRCATFRHRPDYRDSPSRPTGGAAAPAAP